MTADAGSFITTGYPIPPRMHPRAGSFAASPQDVGLGRSLTIDFNLPASIKLPRLNNNIPFVWESGAPNDKAIRWWQDVVERLEAAYRGLATSVTTIQAAYNAAAQATTTATEAISAAQTAQTTADEVSETVTQIQSGELALSKINVGGTTYVTSGGGLIAEP